MKSEKKMKDKEFSFFAELQEIKVVTHLTFGTLHLVQNMIQSFVKVKKPNLDNPPKLFTFAIV
jgi:hypothetical protein